MKFSKREIRLMMLLAVVVVLAIVYFGVNYVIETTDTSDEEYSTAKSQADYVRMIINNDENIKEAISEYEKQTSELSKKFLPLMSTVDVDRYITDIIRNGGATPMMLVVSDVTSASPTEYVPFSAEAQSYYENTGSIYLYSVQFTCVSDYTDNLQTIVDALNSIESLRIESFTITSGGSQMVLTADISLYMFDSQGDA